MLSTRAKPAVVAAREAADIIGGRSGLRELADERLAGLARSGSERAFAVLYLRYHRELYRYCRSALVNEADAHDAMQSAFASGLALIQAGKGSLPVRPWLYKLAHEQVTVLSRSREYLPVSP